jgi:hypothetical protein
MLTCQKEKSLSPAFVNFGGKTGERPKLGAACLKLYLKRCPGQFREHSAHDPGPRAEEVRPRGSMWRVFRQDLPSTNAGEPMLQAGKPGVISTDKDGIISFLPKCPLGSRVRDFTGELGVVHGFALDPEYGLRYLVLLDGEGYPYRQAFTGSQLELAPDEPAPTPRPQPTAGAAPSRHVSRRGEGRKAAPGQSPVARRGSSSR